VASTGARAVHDTFYPHMIVSAGAFPGAREHGDRLAWHDKLGQAEVDMLVAEGRLRELRDRTPTEDDPRTRGWVSVPWTAEEVNAVNRLGAREDWSSLHSHDGINMGMLVRFRCEQLRIAMECPGCSGHSTVERYPGQRADAETWERTEPPEGEGWQLWETVSEGSPISPVFVCADDLALWLTTPAACWGAMQTPMTIDQARGFVGVGSAPSGLDDAGGMHDGATYVGTRAALGGRDDL